MTHASIRNRNDEIAIHAAWQEVQSSVSVDASRNSVSVPPERLHRFLGFIEGRLRIKVPSLWEKSILGAMVDHGSVGFPFLEDDGYRMTGLNLLGRLGTSLEKGESDLILSVDNEFIRIPNRTIYRIVPEENTTRLDRLICAVADPHKCYVALHSNRAFPYSLYCIERGTGNMVWKATVRAAGGRMIYMGFGHHYVDLRVDDDRVVVFGAADDCAYIEILRKTDGCSLFYFKTSP